MFCRNCGAMMNDAAAVCTNCGCYREKPGRFCHNCGLGTMPGAQVCPRCGVSLNNLPPVPPGYSQKSKIAAGLLAFFLGSLGVHNFYLGYTGKGVAQLLITLLTCGFGSLISAVWGIVDGVQVLSGTVKLDGRGFPIGD